MKVLLHLVGVFKTKSGLYAVVFGLNVRLLTTGCMSCHRRVYNSSFVCLFVCCLNAVQLKFLSFVNRRVKECVRVANSFEMRVVIKTINHRILFASSSSSKE